MRASLCFMGKVTPGRYCDCAYVACKCSLVANDADIAYGWRIVKSVVVSLSGGQESRSGSHLAITDQHDPQAVREVCRNFNSGRCFYSKYLRRHVCSSCEGALPAVSCPRSTRPIK